MQSQLMALPHSVPAVVVVSPVVVVLLMAVVVCLPAVVLSYPSASLLAGRFVVV
jgi:hypothetical protein